MIKGINHRKFYSAEELAVALQKLSLTSCYFKVKNGKKHDTFSPYQSMEESLSEAVRFFKEKTENSESESLFINAFTTVDGYRYQNPDSICPCKFTDESHCTCRVVQIECTCKIENDKISVDKLKYGWDTQDGGQQHVLIKYLSLKEIPSFSDLRNEVLNLKASKSIKHSSIEATDAVPHEEMARHFANERINPTLQDLPSRKDFNQNHNISHPQKRVKSQKSKFKL